MIPQLLRCSQWSFFTSTYINIQNSVATITRNSEQHVLAQCRALSGSSFRICFNYKCVMHKTCGIISICSLSFASFFNSQGNFNCSIFINSSLVLRFPQILVQLKFIENSPLAGCPWLGSTWEDSINQCTGKHVSAKAILNLGSIPQDPDYGNRFTYFSVNVCNHNSFPNETRSTHAD